jgi:hypothetical protein
MDRARDPDFAQRLFGGRPEHRLALMRAAWPAAVGPDVARRAEVVAIDRNVLRIKVPDPRWQRTLLRMRPEILSRLRAVAGDAAPRALGFVVGPVAEAATPSASPPARPGSAGRRRPLPPVVTEAADAIPDADVRARFLDAAEAYFARFGGGQGSDGSSGGATG